MNELKRFLLVTIVPHALSDQEALKELKELKALVETFGGKVCDLVVQRREVHDKGMYVGRGKLQEVVEIVEKQEIDVVVLNARVIPAQIHEMKLILMKANSQILVWDRVDLILQIFAKHAHSAESKLQIELASMRHMGPRIYGMGMVMSRQGGGIGTLGVGETNTELMKRHWRQQMKKTEEKLLKHTQDRKRQLRRREKTGIQTASIIGYTNAGKTSLFNLLTKKKNVVQNALFVTLDSSTGKVYLSETRKEILLSDTIGFIRNLPPGLIDAFKSTLMESIHADVLLFVVDSADEDIEKKISVVEQILFELRLHNKRRIYVFNKIDRLLKGKQKSLAKRYISFAPGFISVKQEKGIKELLHSIGELLSKPYVEVVRPELKKRRKIIHL